MDDHCAAIDFLIEKGDDGEVYNVGAGNEKTNMDITDRIISHLGKPESLKTFVSDRLGHDRRYSVECSKIHSLGWAPQHTLEDALVRHH